MKPWIIVAASVAAFAAQPAAAQTLRYNTWEPAGVGSAVEMGKYFEDVAKASGGKLSGKIFPGGQLLGPTAALKGIGDGVVDGGFVVSTFSLGAMPATNIAADLMFYVNEPKVSAAATLETLLLDCENCRQEAQAAKVAWLGGFAPSPWYMMCREPVRSTADLKGRKIRITGASAPRLVASFGGVAVQMPPTELGSALQGGQIDCALGPLPWIKDYGLMDTVKTVVDLPMGVSHALGLYVFNRRFYDGLKEPERKALLDSIPASVVRGTNMFINDGERARSEAMAKGITFWKPDSALTDAVRKFLDAEVPFVVEDVRKRGVKDPEALVKRHLANVEKWRGRVAEMKGDDVKLTAAIGEIVAKMPK